MFIKHGVSIQNQCFKIKRRGAPIYPKKNRHNSARILASLSTFCTSSIEKRATSVVMMFSEGKRPSQNNTNYFTTSIATALFLKN